MSGHRHIGAIFKLASWTALTLVVGALTTKVIAITAGAVGLGYFSIYRQIQQTIISVATLNGDTAIVQGISSREVGKKKGYAETVEKVILANVLIAVLILLFFSPKIINLFGGKNIPFDQPIVFALIGASFFASLSVFLMGVLNGYGFGGKMAKSQAIASCFGLICALTIFYLNKYEFYYLILIFIAATNLIICIRYIRLMKLPGFSCQSLIAPFSKNDAKYFLSISSVALVVGFSGSSTLLYLRVKLIEIFGAQGAGLFDASWTISTVYLTLFLSTFGTHFLPRLSAISDTKIFNGEIIELMRLSLLVSLMLIFGGIYLKSELFKIFYSTDFGPSVNIFRWMAIGDFFKVSAWVLSIPMLARSYMRIYLALSLSWNAIFIFGVSFSALFFPNIEVVGFVYMITQVLYVAASIFYWINYRGLRFPMELLKLWALCFIFIIIYSVLLWEQASLSLSHALLGILMALTVLFYYRISLPKRKE